MRIRTEELEAMILFEDKSLIVCKKPAFLAVETKNPRQQDLISLLRTRRMRKGEEPYIGVIHRLDQPVEGALVFAKDARSAAHLSNQVQKGLLTKEYMAVVSGAVTSDGDLTHFLKKDNTGNTSAVVAEGTPGAKKAHLSFRVIKHTTDRSLLHIKLDTGRHHQIRVQLAAIGHPIVGDAKYSDATEAVGEALALCACHLEFTHPDTGETMKFTVTPEGNAFRW